MGRALEVPLIGLIRMLEADPMVQYGLSDWNVLEERERRGRLRIAGGRAIGVLARARVAVIAAGRGAAIAAGAIAAGAIGAGAGAGAAATGRGGGGGGSASKRSTTVRLWLS